MSKSRVQFFEESGDSKKHKKGCIYCRDRSGFQIDVLKRTQVQKTITLTRRVFGSRVQALTPRYTELLSQLQTVHGIEKICTQVGHFPWWITGDGAAMYQLDATNVRFALTVIAALCPLMGRPSALALHVLLKYADRDDAKCIKEVLADDGVRKALSIEWPSFDVCGERFTPKFHGFTMDTKILWESLRRKPDRGWTKGLGGTFRERALFMKTDDNGITTCVLTCCTTCR
jgi:hypothetical protein